MTIYHTPHRCTPNSTQLATHTHTAGSTPTQSTTTSGTTRRGLNGSGRRVVIGRLLRHKHPIARFGIHKRGEGEPFRRQVVKFADPNLSAGHVREGEEGRKMVVAEFGQLVFQFRHPPRQPKRARGLYIVGAHPFTRPFESNLANSALTLLVLPARSALNFLVAGLVSTIPTRPGTTLTGVATTITPSISS